MWADQNPLLPGQTTSVHAQLADLTTNTWVNGATVNFNFQDDTGTQVSATTDSTGTASVDFTGGVSPTLVNAQDLNGYGAVSAYLVGVASAGPSGPHSYNLAVWADSSTLTSGQPTSLYARLMAIVPGAGPVRPWVEPRSISWCSRETGC